MSAVALGVTIALVEKSLGLQRQMHLVLERRVLARRQQSGIVGNCLAQRFNPRPVALRKVRQTWLCTSSLMPG